MDPKADRKENLRWVERVLWLVALILLAVPAIMWAESLAYQYYLERAFDQRVRTSSVPITGLGGSSGNLLSGTSDAESRTEAFNSADELAAGLVGRIEIDRLDLSAMIQKGVDETTLRRGVGHLPSSPLPGQQGNVVLAAHRDTFFRPLEWIEEGDVISVETADGRFIYEVSWTAVVEPEAVDVLDPTPERAATLVTCYPFAYIGPAPQRFIVRARQILFEQLD